MPSAKTLVPRPVAEFDKMFNTVCVYTGAKLTSGAWTHIPAAEHTKLTAAYADWRAAYEPTLNDHTKGAAAAKRTARSRDEKVLRNFIQTWFRRFPAVVLAEDLAAMGIPQVDTTRSRIGVPKTRPVFTLEVRGTRLLAVLFHDELTPTSRARPYGMNGAVIFFAVLDHPPKDISELTRTELATRTPFLLHFTEEERGKTVYIAMEWQNESGERGDPTEIQSTVVP
jgi:hypothetical protein